MSDSYRAPYHMYSRPSLPKLHRLRRVFDERLRIGSFESLLLDVMDDAHHHDIQDARHWLLEHATTPELLDAALEYMVAAAEATPHCMHRMAVLFVIDELLVYAHRCQLHDWIKYRALEHLPDLLHGIHDTAAAAGDKHMAKMEQLVKAWGEKGIYDPKMLDDLLVFVRHPPAIDTTKPCSLFPAGLLAVLLKSKQAPYTPVKPTALKAHFPFVSEMVLDCAVDEFYAGLPSEHDEAADAPADVLFTWEKGYLDDYYAAHKKKMQSLARLAQQDARQRSRSRSRSPKRSTAPSRHQHRHRSPPPSFSSSHRRAPSPPPAVNAGLGSSAAPTAQPPMFVASESRHMGLGADQAADAFDEFRKRSSYNYTKDVRQRDPVATGPKCFHCNKYGHIARNCPTKL
ncbi:hypothetical protein BC940DRAFT_294772 [Gongronella butleri]|nr:hypothetical protein BC940DRAFT_294772 [Gongronella butleri]